MENVFVAICGLFLFLCFYSFVGSSLKTIKALEEFKARLDQINKIVDRQEREERKQDFLEEKKVILKADQEEIEVYRLMLIKKMGIGMLVCLSWLAFEVIFGLKSPDHFFVGIIVSFFGAITLFVLAGMVGNFIFHLKKSFKKGKSFECVK